MGKTTRRFGEKGGYMKKDYSGAPADADFEGTIVDDASAGDETSVAVAMRKAKEKVAGLEEVEEVAKEVVEVGSAVADFVKNNGRRVMDVLSAIGNIELKDEPVVTDEPVTDGYDVVESPAKSIDQLVDEAVEKRMAEVVDTIKNIVDATISSVVTELTAAKQIDREQLKADLETSRVKGDEKRKEHRDEIAAFLMG